MAKKKNKKNAACMFGALDSQLFNNSEIQKVMLMTELASMGVSPDEYKEFLKIHGTITDLLGLGDHTDTEAGHDMSLFGEPVESKQRKKDQITEKPTNGDDTKATLRLKIQMKGVRKPPMWRLVEVPDSYNFSQLHFVIQAVTGLTDSHLWKFQKKAYDGGYAIGVDSGDGLFDPDYDDANTTCISNLLAVKGDKMEYVYDFGDDWIFEIKVEEVIPGECGCPELLKWKSDFQPMEDSGGPYMYMHFRDIADRLPSMKKSEIKKIANNLGCDDPEWLTEQLEESHIDPEHIAEVLADIPSKYIGM